MRNLLPRWEKWELVRNSFPELPEMLFLRSSTTWWGIIFFSLAISACTLLKNRDGYTARSTKKVVKTVVKTVVCNIIGEKRGKNRITKQKNGSYSSWMCASFCDSAFLLCFSTTADLKKRKQVEVGIYTLPYICYLKWWKAMYVGKGITSSSSSPITLSDGSFSCSALIFWILSGKEMFTLAQ